MSKLIVSEFVSLNGVIEAPGGEHGPSPYRLDFRVALRRRPLPLRLADAISYDSGVALLIYRSAES